MEKSFPTAAPHIRALASSDGISRASVLSDNSEGINDKNRIVNATVLQTEEEVSKEPMGFFRIQIIDR